MPGVLRLMLCAIWGLLLTRLGLAKRLGAEWGPEWFEPRPWAIDALNEIARHHPAPPLVAMQDSLHRRRIARWLA